MTYAEAPGIHGEVLEMKMTHDGTLQCGTQEEGSAGTAGFAAAGIETGADTDARQIGR